MLISRAATALQMHSHQQQLGQQCCKHAPPALLTPEGPLGEEAHCSATNAKQQGVNEG
jgi:hypothetical protein